MVVLVAVLVAVGVLVGPADRAEASGCTASVPDGHIRVVVVVDLGDGGGPSATCLVVPAGTTGSQALARRAAELGRDLPRYAGSGLLCAIDDLPAPPACGDRSAGGFRYWAYFNGTSGSWIYGTYNPFIRRLSDGDVEGWRYVDGAGNGSDPPPRMAPSPSLFPPLAPPAPPVLEPSAPTAGTGGSGGGGSGGGGTAGAAVVGGGAEASGIESSTPAMTQPGDGPVELAIATVGSRSEIADGAGTAGTAWVPVAVVVALIAAFGAGAVVRGRRPG